MGHRLYGLEILRAYLGSELHGDRKLDLFKTEAVGIPNPLEVHLTAAGFIP